MFPPVVFAVKSGAMSLIRRVIEKTSCILFNTLYLYERFINNEEISLISPHQAPGLYDAFGTEDFDDLYEKYEEDKSIPREVVKAQDLFFDLLKERAETGRIYIMNIHHCNTHSSFKDKVSMSN